MYGSFDLGVNGLILADDNIVSWFPLEPSLPSNDIIRIYLSPSQNLYSKYKTIYPSLLPAESFVFWVDEACILDAIK